MSAIHISTLRVSLGTSTVPAVNELMQKLEE